MKRRILFFAECVTLAHMARPMVLAESLDPSEFEVFFASNGRYDHLFGSPSFAREQISTLSSELFLQRLAKGQPLYDEHTLRAYVEEDLTLLARIKPDVVVGDFRLSLSVSARLAKIPYATITNVYWSPFARQHWPVPELPMTRFAPIFLAQGMFNLVRPVAFALHTRPLNAVRRQFGLPSLGLDLRNTYTDADLTLYSDLPGLIETSALPSTHRFIGPINWSPDLPLPAWWEHIDGSRPIIYLTPGSSGSTSSLAGIATALSSLPATVMVATAGRHSATIASEGVFAADYLPGGLACAKADIVICNGGSPTCYQALAEGKPVLGIPSNLDQHLNMQAVTRAGAGIAIRSDEASTARIALASETMAHAQTYREASLRVAQSISECEPRKLFLESINMISSSPITATRDY